MSEGLSSALRFLRAPRLGIEVGSRSVRSVLVVKGRIVRTATADLNPSDPLEMVLQRLLDENCRGVRRRPRVCAAVGASASQIRRLVNLPAIASDRALRDVVRSSVGRFFLKNGVPLLTSSVCREGDGTGWAAAIEEPPVHAMAAACRSRRLRLAVAAPAVIALQRAMTGHLLQAGDGDAVLEAHVGSRGELRNVRRTLVHGDVSTERQSAPVSELEGLGTDAGVYAAAYGATEIDDSEPLALHARELRQWQDTSVPTWRLLFAIAALLMAMTLAITLPALRATRVAAHTSTRLAKVNREYRAAQWTEAELQRTTIALDELGAFQVSRRSMTEFLAELTATLPENVWLQSVHVDEQGGAVVALAPRAASALAGLSALRSITEPIIVGAVSNEQIGRERIERVTIRFRWRTAKLRGARP